MIGKKIHWDFWSSQNKRWWIVNRDGFHKRSENLRTEFIGMRNVNLELLNSLKIIRTSFHENNSWRPEVWQHYDRLERKCENHWLRIEFPSKNNQQITNLVLCRLRIFYIEVYSLRSWYLEFCNFCKLIRRVGRASYRGFLSFSTQPSGSISNFKESSKPLKNLVKTCLEETSRAQTRCRICHFMI